MSVTLRKRKNSDGSTSLFLAIYNDGKYSYEFLKHLKLSSKSNPADKQGNIEKLAQAKRIALKKAQELSANDYDMTSETGKTTLVTEWMQSFVDGYEKKDKRNMQGALNRFKDFLVEKKRQGLTFSKLSEVIISDFQEHLRKNSVGEGASSYFSRFKKMVKRAYNEKLLYDNPASKVKTIVGKAAVKDILTLEEIKLLAATPTESNHVKQAFLFSTMTGLRWCDVKALKWGNISGTTMILVQSKTKNRILVNLNEAAIKLLGNTGKKNELVFDLPTANGCNKTLQAWVDRAEIDKKISWHCARHSFGTNLAYQGVDISTIADLMGHNSLKHTQRYRRASDELKQQATNKINIDL